MPATDKYFRNLKTVHVVFALSTVGLFASTIWMMAADHADPWREIQKTNFRIDAERTRAELNAVKSDETYQERQARLAAELAEATAKIDQQKSDVDALEADLRKARREADLAEREVKARRAQRDVARANYDLGVRDNLPPERLKALKDEFDREQELVNQLELELQRKTTAQAEIEQKLAGLNADRNKFLDEKKKLDADVERLTKALDTIAPESAFRRAKREIMQWAIIDGFNSPTKIRQDWLPKLRIKLGMAESARFDRCRTCHLNSDLVEAGNKPAYPHGHPTTDDINDWVKNKQYPHPFATHPRPELYVTAASPHSVEKFGCTICHEGQGAATEFSNSAHYPNDPHVQLQWEEEYGFKKNHFWEYPMYPKRFRESSCIKCHHSVVELGVHPKHGATAPKLYQGYQLIQDYGCFGCHEIQGYTAGKSIGPDIRLEPSTDEERKKLEADPTLIAGRMRKVGPALRHIGAKTTEEFVAYWTEEPKRFRPKTRMPQFFNLVNQQDAHGQEYTPVELAGIARYLFDKSQPLELLKPEAEYQPNAERGKQLFATRGCLSCHSKSDFPGTTADFGPDLSRVHEKILPGEDGFNWLYTWVRDPQRHHPRSRMPNLFLETYTEGESTIDPAADIAAYLLTGGPGKFTPPELTPYLGVGLDEQFDADEAAALGLDGLFGARIVDIIPGSPATRATVIVESAGAPAEVKRELEVDDVIVGFNGAPVRDAAELHKFVNRTAVGTRVSLEVVRHRENQNITVVVDEPLNDEVRLYLGKVLKAAQVEALMSSGEYPIPLKQVTGDEIELETASGAGEPNAEEFRRRKLDYVGRRTISRYGCFGCHDIPGFEDARPIGTTLQDWGRKDTSRLAPEHIEEYLHHHGEADGSSTRERAEQAVAKAARGDFKNKHDEQHELSAAYFYEDLLHHGRPGFIWQKLRSPRSYDYRKTETKGYDERLRMPLFPFQEDEIEAIATFVLGLVADPPPADYQYRPRGSAVARLEGERLIDYFNCVGCHIVELPEIRGGVDMAKFAATPVTAADHPEALELLLRFKPPHNGQTGEKITAEIDGTKKTLDVVSFYGLVNSKPNEDSTEYGFDVWEPVKVGDILKLPPDRVIIDEKALLPGKPARGGNFAQWLVDYLQTARVASDRQRAWQKSPPPLYKEGIKVQTPWLYRFLRDPYRIRPEAVLRMPKFNLSPDEAQSLANYFASVDGAPYPYQYVPEREPSYIDEKNEELKPVLDDGKVEYLSQAWKTLNLPLCIKCHSLGGRTFKISDPVNDVRGPDLQQVTDRLRSDWLLLWLYKPQWITPYTSMPPPFAKNQPQFRELFGGDPKLQTIAVRDALMNYHRLMEREGKVEYESPQSTASTGAAAQ
ncbi:MAG: c-type cytochrome [Planctomycetaceae bacterium]